MLLKTYLVSLIFAVAPVLATAQEVSSGGWPDGTALVWQCQKGASGTIKFIFQTPDGKQYAGMFSCGIGV